MKDNEWGKENSGGWGTTIFSVCLSKWNLNKYRYCPIPN